MARTQIDCTSLEGTHFSWLGERYEGKVRDCYVREGQRVLIATDRLSAFDRVLTTVPGKGQVLTQMAKYWFDKTGSIVANHVIAAPDPCVMVVREVSIIPIEVVVRGFLAGSAWRDYKAGHPVSGIVLPPGLREFDQLEEPIVTPATKAAVGAHDLPISERELLDRRLVSESVWSQVREIALALFECGRQEVERRGLLFVDTKYEFGMLDGTVVLADEIHTLDSSRFWVKDSYESQRQKGEAPEMLDKEPIRRWLMERGFMGEGMPPEITDSYRMELREYYRASASRITGEQIVLDDSEPVTRVEANLRRYFGS